MEQQETWAFDFDSTLSFYEEPFSTTLGPPVPEMVRKVKAAIAEGVQVVIFSARVYPGADYERLAQSTNAMLNIAEWCQKHIGQVLPITFVKMPIFTKLYDDRAIEILPNTGVELRDLIEATKESD